MKVPAGKSESPSSPADEAAIGRYNQRAIALKAQRRYADAVAVFREAMSRFPHEAGLHNNLAVTLEESGDAPGALEAYCEAARLDPDLWAAHFGAGMLLMRANDFARAEQRFQRTVALAPDMVQAHLAIYELAQIRGDREMALDHQTRALARQSVFSHAAPLARRSVLAVMAPGDWQANIPIDFLFDLQTTSLHKLYLTGAGLPGVGTLPPYDLLFNAIAESDEAVGLLESCERFINEQRKPYLNHPRAVLDTNRVRLVNALRDVDCHVPATARVAREELERGTLAFDPPLIVRPVGSHAGRGLEKIDRADDLPGYLRRVDAPAYYVMQYVDYRSMDGYFRKYRIILVDGVAYPFHLAISDRWMVHYYNSLMQDFPWMRAEEERYLREFEAVFTPAQRKSLHDVAAALQLDYFGVDCAIGPDGRILVFEADPGVIVHASDSAELFAYKLEYVPRIFRAIERMVDERLARSR